jgi:UDP:flavonoid glycosyltransferase YjiC (YdhE family)
MKILFTAGSLLGHVNTMLPLALAAQRAGHEVVFVTGPDFASHVQSVGLHCWPIGLTHAQAGGSRQASWLEYFVRTAQARLAGLMPRALNWKPDIVVHEDTEPAGAVVALACHARHFVHGLSLMPPARLAPWYDAALTSLSTPYGLSDAARQLRDAVYLEVCPPALQPTGERIWRRTLSLRPATGVAMPTDSLPQSMASCVVRLLDEPQFASAAAVVRSQINLMPDAAAVLNSITAPA